VTQGGQKNSKRKSTQTNRKKGAKRKHERGKREAKDEHGKNKITLECGERYCDRSSGSPPFLFRGCWDTRRYKKGVDSCVSESKRG